MSVNEFRRRNHPAPCRLPIVFLFAALLAVWAGPRTQAADYHLDRRRVAAIADHDAPPLVV